MKTLWPTSKAERSFLALRATPLSCPRLPTDMTSAFHVLQSDNRQFEFEYRFMLEIFSTKYKTLYYAK